MNKVVADIDEALAGLNDGSRVMISGFGLSGNPERLIQGVVEHGAKDLTLISNNAGSIGKGLATWLKAGIVSKVVCSFVGNNADLQAAIDGGRVQVSIVPQGTLAERMRAAGAGIPAFFTATGVGTSVALDKEVRRFDGRDYLLERALSADIALIRAHVADRFGNVRFYRTSRNFAPAMAMAATTTVVEAERVEALDPDDVHLPGVFVQRVLHFDQHENPIE